MWALDDMGAKGAVQRSESMQLSHSITRNQKGDTRTWRLTNIQVSDGAVCSTGGKIHGLAVVAVRVTAARNPMSIESEWWFRLRVRAHSAHQRQHHTLWWNHFNMVDKFSNIVEVIYWSVMRPTHDTYEPISQIDGTHVVMQCDLPKLLPNMCNCYCVISVFPEITDARRQVLSSFADTVFITNNVFVDNIITENISYV
jgi:hypothetical protein